MLRVAPSCSEYSQKSPPSKNPSAPSCSECSECSPKIPTPQKIRVLQAAPSAPKKAIVQKSPPSKSELLRVLKKSYRQKIHHPQKIRVLRVAPSAPKKAIAQNAPHHFVIAPRPTTHYLCFQKSQISHVHKHNAFQFRLRNRNISSS